MLGLCGQAINSSLLIVGKVFGLTPIQLVFSYAKRYKLVLGITILSMFLLVGARLLVPAAITKLIDTVTTLDRYSTII